MLNDAGGRKFIFGVLLALGGTVAMFMGIATFPEWATFTAVVGASYMTANVAERMVK